MFLYKLCGYIKSEWKTEVNEDIVEIIYNNKFSKEEKLYNINNKINIKVDGYISIVMKQCHTYVG